MDRSEENASTLTAPLIKNQEKITGENGGSSDLDKKERIIEELRKQLWLAGPLISVSLLQFCLQLISVMFVGHLGELALSGASMATSFASVTGFSLLMGMASALDTLCGQSYGAKQYHMLGIHLQRAMLVLFLTCIPLALVWANTAPHHVSTYSPDIIQGCDLHEGEFGHVGSIISWRYTHDGKECIGKQVIEKINEEEKLIAFKMLEGDLLELYKTFVATMHVETKGDIDLVTCTLDYEMLNEDVEHPTSMLSLWIHLIKDIETHHPGQP